MEFSNELLGGYSSKLINIRQFKTENAYEMHPIKVSKVTERKIFAKIQSINPNADISSLQNEIKLCEAKLQKLNFQDFFDSPDSLNARCLFPIYDTATGDLQTLKKKKSDLYQTKRTRIYSPLPNFTPRGNIVPGQTVLITISVYHPFHWVSDQDPDEAVIPHCNDSIQFHETQTLRDIKQAIKCGNEDSEISGDISECPHKPFEYIKSSDLKHGLFYINNTLYVDSVHPDITLAHANTIKKWAEENGKPIEDVKTIETQLLDLEVCIGQPYIYQHLGRCEHLFIFNDISFAQTNDCLGQNNYPRIVSTAKDRLKNCIFCNKCMSSIVMISEDNRTPVTVNHMCEPCFISYNYNSIGEKVADFKAYRAIKWRK
ncbi:snRNA-activating protein complex subunit 3-like [Adelges cooleyi]|uniref:snRNA-activating protein complex subunit 3-like n=1 Tax=Adelges cooleyi TaxID=133065 RepID=UPI00217F743C|nr:snRNA-activating protein complex subunit 3-like [Adelges cooleyi]